MIVEAGRYFKSISRGIITYDMSKLKDRINSILDKPLLNYREWGTPPLTHSKRVSFYVGITTVRKETEGS